MSLAFSGIANAIQDAQNNLQVKDAQKASAKESEMNRTAMKTFARSMTVSMRGKAAPQNSSRMSEGVVSVTRRMNILRTVWNHNDFTVCKILAQLVKARI